MSEIVLESVAVPYTKIHKDITGLTASAALDKQAGVTILHNASTNINWFWSCYLDSNNAIMINVFKQVTPSEGTVKCLRQKRQKIDKLQD